MAKRNDINDIVFSGTLPPPPPPVPEPVRRDSMGRKISMTALEALKATQFKPGTSGNPGRHQEVEMANRAAEEEQAEPIPTRPI